MLVISVAYGRAAWTRACALAMREVAIISWALVIFLMFPAERIRPRSSRSVAAIAVLSLVLLRCGLADLNRFLAHVGFVHRLGVLVGNHRAPVGCREALLELVDHVGQLVGDFVGELLGFRDLFENLAVRRPYVVQQFG